MPEMSVDKRRQEQYRENESRGRSLSRRGEYPDFWSNPWSVFSMNPFALMRQFTDDMDRNFWGSRTGESTMWSPAIDVSQREGELVVHADLPGLNQEDIKIEVTQDGLVIQGERKREHEEKGSWGYRSERSYGSFYRTIPLPEGAKIEDAKAHFNNGVLEVHVPVVEAQGKRRQIPIAGGSSERKPAASETPAQKQEVRAR